MLKRLWKRPACGSLLALIACAVWPLRPLDRTALFPVQFANGKYGYVNPDGRVAVAGVWDEAYSFAADGRALVKREDKFGFIDREGKLFAPLGSEVEYKLFSDTRKVLFWAEKRIEYLHSGQLVCARDNSTPLWKQKPEKFGLRQNGKDIVEATWDDILPFDAADLAAVQRAEKWGFINRSQEIVIPLEWEFVQPFAKNGLALVMKDGKSGFIDRSGKIIIPPEWDEASSFSDNGLACVRKDRKFGYIDRTGKIVIPIAYDQAEDFDHLSMARITLGERQGFIDAKGTLVIPLEWETIRDFDGPPAALSPGMERIDAYGRSAPKDSQVARHLPNKNGLACVEWNEKYGCINRKGEVIIHPQWDQDFHFDDNGYALVTRNQKYGFINRKGDIVVPVEWDGNLFFDDKQMARAKKGGKYGFIDGTGKIVIPLVWDYAYEFDAKDMAIVERGGKRGFINRQGEIVVPLIWEFTSAFRENDIAIVCEDKKVGTINRKGEIGIPMEWDALIDLKENSSLFFGGIRTGCHGATDPLTPNVVLALKDKKCGVIDWAGNIITAPEWQMVVIRTDAGAEQCCFVVSRNADDGVQPGWMKSARDWLLGLIGRAEQRNVVCHLYATDGVLLWSSDWLSSTFWSLAIGGLAGIVLIADIGILWRRRRASVTPSANS